MAAEPAAAEGNRRMSCRPSCLASRPGNSEFCSVLAEGSQSRDLGRVAGEDQCSALLGTDVRARHDAPRHTA